MRNGMKQIAFLLALATAEVAHADAKDEARRHFDRAVELVDDGQIDGALVEFQRSYDLTHHFAVLYNIGQVLVSLARPVEACDAYQRYLAEGRDKVPATRRAEVEKEILRQKARIATLEIRVLPDGALVRVDGKEIGKAPIGVSLRVGVGKHAVMATAEGYDPVASEIAVAGEDHKVVNLVLTKSAVEKPLLRPAATVVVPVAPVAPLAPAVGGVVVVPLGPSAKQSMSKLRIAGIVIGAVGVASLAAGTGFWLAAESRHSDAMNVYEQDYIKAKGLQSDAENYVMAANISLIAGGTLAALGVVSFILGAPDKPATTAGMHAHLLPFVGSAGAGLSAGGIW
jgi:hypothetical protein